MLFGQSPGGLNATGESDIRLFYDQVAAAQRRKLIPALKYITELFLSMRFKNSAPDDWQITCNPLWQPTENEQADTNHKQAQADKIYLEAGVVSPMEIAQSRFEGNGTSLDTQIDKELRDEMGDVIVPDAPDDSGNSSDPPDVDIE
jgi:phage-related protein (TIGR01555 family)